MTSEMMKGYMDRKYICIHDQECQKKNNSQELLEKLQKLLLILTSLTEVAPPNKNAMLPARASPWPCLIVRKNTM